MDENILTSESSIYFIYLLSQVELSKNGYVECRVDYDTSLV